MAAAAVFVAMHTKMSALSYRQRLDLMRHIYGGGGEGLDSPSREEALLACMELSSRPPPIYLANPQRWVVPPPPATWSCLCAHAADAGSRLL